LEHAKNSGRFKEVLRKETLRASFFLGDKKKEKINKAVEKRIFKLNTGETGC